jgi:hypothetical protein
MELLDRYLQAVKKHLPWQRQDDILAELRANLESQLEDQEAEIGRPLTAAEVETWLKQIGPPMMVAARYQKQQYVIGPAVFPMYWYVLRLASFWVLIAYAVANAVLIASSANPSMAAVVEAAVRVPFVLMNVAAWITLTFAAFEYAIARSWITWPASSISPEGWSPSSLPPLDKQAATGKKPRSYAMAVAEVVFGFLFLGWLLLVPKHPVLMFGPGAVYMQVSSFQLEPVWYTFYWWVVGLNVLQLAWRCIDLDRGTWQGPRLVQQTVTKLLGLIPLVILITAPGHLLLTLKHPEVDGARYGQTIDSINIAIHHGLIVVCAIVILQLLWEIGQRSLEAYRRRLAANH